MDIDKIKLYARDYVQQHGALPEDKEKGRWKFKIGVCFIAFWETTFDYQLKLAKEEAQKQGLDCIELFEKLPRNE